MKTNRFPILIAAVAVLSWAVAVTAQNHVDWVGGRAFFRAMTSASRTLPCCRAFRTMCTTPTAHIRRS